MISHFKCWFQVVLRGLAQVAFAERLIAGVLAGTVAGRLQGTLNRARWEAGFSVPNPAIVGILWGVASAKAA